MNHIEAITRNDKFADRWTILLDWGETITASDNPSHPQGVVSHNNGYYISSEDEQVDFEDLPETLKMYLARYIAEQCDHEDAYQTDTDFWYCPDCHATLDEENNILQVTPEIPY